MNRISNTLLLETAVVVSALAAKADYVCEDELDGAVVVQQMSVPRQVADLRTTFPVASLEDAALTGLMYSANSWVRDAAEDASRTARITAQAGTLANGVFTPDGNAEVTVGTGLTGEGTVDWAVSGISKKVYRLTHTALRGGSVDAGGTCYGYFDFTHCTAGSASQADVEAAVLGAITHKIAVMQDEVWPWQPIDTTAVRSGIVTDEALEPETETATVFAFKGHGVLHYEYDLSGGTLVVIADDKVKEAYSDDSFPPIDVSYFFGEDATAVCVDPAWFPDRKDIARSAMEHDWGEDTHLLIELWSRVKGNNADTLTVIVVAVAVVAVLSLVVMRKVKGRGRSHKKHSGHRK